MFVSNTLLKSFIVTALSLSIFVFIVSDIAFVFLFLLIISTALSGFSLIIFTNALVIFLLLLSLLLAVSINFSDNNFLLFKIISETIFKSSSVDTSSTDLFKNSSSSFSAAFDTVTNISNFDHNFLIGILDTIPNENLPQYLWIHH